MSMFRKPQSVTRWLKHWVVSFKSFSNGQTENYYSVIFCPAGGASSSCKRSLDNQTAAQRTEGRAADRVSGLSKNKSLVSGEKKCAEAKILSSPFSNS